MKYPHEQKLRAKGLEFIESLNLHGFRSFIIEDSFREFSVKLSIKRGAEKEKASIYYSPKKNSFRLTTNEISDPELVKKIETIWEEPLLAYLDDPPTKAGSLSDYIAYVDGSFIESKIGYGAVVLKNSEVVREFYGPVISEDAISSRQIAGEIEAVVSVLNWCVENNIKDITIHYDYRGLEMWARAKWKTNLPLTRRYADLVSSSGVHINWVKVPAHSGDKWNDYADELAKKGAGSAA